MNKPQNSKYLTISAFTQKYTGILDPVLDKLEKYPELYTLVHGIKLEMEGDLEKLESLSAGESEI